MPRSAAEGRDWVVDRLKDTTAPIIYDFGCGEGAYSDLAKGWRSDALWIGVEVWQPYIDKFDLWRKYDVVANRDIRDIDFPETGFVLLAGDVLEHLHRPDALDILHRAKQNAEAIMVSVPVVDYPQHDHDNHYENHLDQWSFADMYDVLADGKLDAWRGETLGRFWWTPK